MSSLYLNRIRKDDVYPATEVKPLQDLTGLPARKGLENAIISAGQIVNVVSKQHCHLRNEDFFLQVEEALINADLEYLMQTTNRDNRSFAVDFILNDDRYAVNIKSGKDEILPMLRFTNGYDGSTSPSGKFGFFRKVCANGLHVAQTNVGFKVKLRGDVKSIVIPQIQDMVCKFMDNEFYQIKRKFDVLAESPIYDLSRFVQVICKDTGVFKFEKSENNPDPAKLSRMVIDIAERETLALGYDNPNLWLGYNAFNEVIHTQLKRTFENQRILDNRILEQVLTLS
jgi:hypothetical protein